MYILYKMQKRKEKIMPALTFVEYIERVLKKRDKKYYTAKQIAEFISKDNSAYFKERMKKSGKNKTAQIEQLVREIYSANAENRVPGTINVTTDSPKKFAYIGTKNVNSDKKIEQREHGLYPLVCEFLANGMNLFAKRIDEKRVSKRNGQNGNKWLFPDIVGLKVLSDNWDANVKNCVRHYHDSETDLWSFEVKLALTMSNVRECFFQTVSNSAWANYSYLVAADIDERALKELQILCKAYNIGIIKLNKDNPLESQIIIPAVKVDGLDWDIINRICESNTDFRDFIIAVENFYSATTNKINTKDWTALPSISQ